MYFVLFSTLEKRERMSYTSFSFAPDENLVVDKILKYICDVVIVICMALFFMTFFCQGEEIVGNSMSPTLVNDQKIFINSLAYALSEPKQGDVIVFDVKSENGENITYVKRIIAVPGDTVRVKDGRMYVNEEEYPLEEAIVNAGNAKNKITLEDGEYFVLGDNVNNSEDSRFSTVGTVNIKAIRGKAWFIYAPFKDIGWIK